MKVYQATANPYLDDNQYVMTLMDGINSQFNDVEWGWGLEVFWQKYIYDFDIVHIHWPDALLWPNRSFKQLENRLKNLRKENIKIVVTCHNLEPHYCNDLNRKNAYNVVYENCDMIIHLGEYSYELLKFRYKNVCHRILPHHIYDTIYSYISNRTECCYKIGLNPNHKYIISFGAFRDDEERKLVREIARRMKKDDFYFIAPAFCQLQNKNLYESVICWLKKIKLHYINHIIVTGKSSAPVSVLDTPLFWGAADIAFIQRKRILNSGNVSMAFLMGKTIIGPNEGNVGVLLKKTKNLTFEVNDVDSICEAIRNGMVLNSIGKGEQNRRYALENLNVAYISSLLYNYYKEIIS